MKTQEEQRTKQKLTLFGVLLVLMSSILYFCILRNGYGINSGSVFAIGLMWVPGAAALASKLVVEHSVRSIGWRVQKGCGRQMIAAYLVPPVLCLVVYGLAWSTGAGTRTSGSVQQTVAFSTVGVLLNCALALGEEIGWRGFLLTELRKLFPLRTANAVIGGVWFLYHAPVILLSNYNNGNIPWSLVCFLGMVLGFTVFADALCVEARSFWPAVLLHASHNTFVQSIFDPMTQNGPFTQFWTSEFGLGLAIAYAVVCGGLVLLQKKH